MKFARKLLRFPRVAIFVALLCPGLCLGQTPGATDKEIVIGSCAALEGPSSFLGRETVAGAEAYFDLINDEAGVNGRRVHLVSYDDSYDPAKAQAC